MKTILNIGNKRVILKRENVRVAIIDSSALKNSGSDSEVCHILQILILHLSNIFNYLIKDLNLSLLRQTIS